MITTEIKQDLIKRLRYKIYPDIRICCRSHYADMDEGHAYALLPTVVDIAVEELGQDADLEKIFKRSYNIIARWVRFSWDKQSREIRRQHGAPLFYQYSKNDLENDTLQKIIRQEELTILFTTILDKWGPHTMLWTVAYLSQGMKLSALARFVGLEEDETFLTTLQQIRRTIHRVIENA